MARNNTSQPNGPAPNIQHPPLVPLKLASEERWPALQGLYSDNIVKRSSLFSFRLNGRPVASIYRPIQKEFCLTSRTDFIQTSLEREKCVFQVSESDNRFLRCRDLGFIAGVIQRGSIHTYTALRYKNYCAIIKVKEFIKFMRLLCRSAMRIRTLLITDTIFLD